LSDSNLLDGEMQVHLGDGLLADGNNWWIDVGAMRTTTSGHLVVGDKIVEWWQQMPTRKSAQFSSAKIICELSTWKNKLNRIEHQLYLIEKLFGNFSVDSKIQSNCTEQ
jgi:hypothetical protein